MYLHRLVYFGGTQSVDWELNVICAIKWTSRKAQCKSFLFLISLDCMLFNYNLKIGKDFGANSVDSLWNQLNSQVCNRLGKSRGFLSLNPKRHHLWTWNQTNHLFCSHTNAPSSVRLVTHDTSVAKIFSLIWKWFGD